MVGAMNDMTAEPQDSQILMLRRKLHRTLFVDNPRHAPSQFANRVVNAAVLVSLLSLLLEHMLPLDENFTRFLKIVDDITITIFVIEYVLRAISGGLQHRYKGASFATLRYLVSPLALLDLVVILPFFMHLESVVDLRFLRLVRLMKIARSLQPIWSEFRKLNAKRSLRQKVYSALNTDHHSGRMNEIVDLVMGKLIFLSVAAVMLETVESIHSPLQDQFRYFDYFTVIVFSIEYVVRVWCCPEDKAFGEGRPGRLRYMATPIAIIDLLSILPFYLSFLVAMDLRFLRAIRLLRLLKFTRYSNAMTTLMEVVVEQIPALSAAFFTTLTVTIFSASLIYLVEHEAQPDKFSSIPEATYWAIITLLSVGYGDITPVTPIGKFVTMIISLAGLGLVALPAGILASGFQQKMQDRTIQFRALVDARVRDGELTDAERLELKLQAASMGLGRYREAELEREEVEAFRRLRQEPQWRATEAAAANPRSQPAQTSPSPAPDLAAAAHRITFSDFDTLLDHIDRLSRVEKLEILARIVGELRTGDATNMERASAN